MDVSDRTFYATRPDVLLRLEGLLALIITCVAYQRIYPKHWGMFALIFLVPDISLLPYLRSNGRRSADFYNIVHSYVLPAVLGLLAWIEGSWLAGQLALIWLSHISFDRLLGYGLKFPGNFRHTHIQSSESSALAEPNV